MSKKLKVLMIADGIGGDIYDKALANALSRLNCNVRSFTWCQYFKNYQYKDDFKLNVYDSPDRFGFFKSIYYRAQNKFMFGPSVYAINKDILEAASEFKPDLVFVYRGTHVYPTTIRKLKKDFSCKVFGYNNDDPFSSRYPRYFWRHFLKAKNDYDHMFCYREKNIRDFADLGIKCTSLLRSYFLKERNFEIIGNIRYDVIFIGHFEDDGRDESIKKLIESGFKVRLYGSHWHNSKYYQLFVDYFGEDICPVFGESYNFALNEAKIALVFFSKFNNDTYTRRCFEIPAARRLMISEYSKDMDENLFSAGVEADYFESGEELLKKVRFYVDNQDEYDKVRVAGHNRLLSDGHEVEDRAVEILRVFNENSPY